MSALDCYSFCSPVNKIYINITDNDNQYQLCSVRRNSEGTFHWFVVIVIGPMLRSDQLGLISIARDLSVSLLCLIARRPAHRLTFGHASSSNPIVPKRQGCPGWCRLHTRQGSQPNARSQEAPSGIEESHQGGTFLRTLFRRHPPSVGYVPEMVLPISDRSGFAAVEQWKQSGSTRMDLVTKSKSRCILQMSKT
ncbi:hypothetical protein D3C74_231580 [compost metagenome]